MKLEWSRYATYCRQCGKPVRISQKTLTDQMERDGGTISEEDTARAVVYCLTCTAGGTVAGGEVITPAEVAVEFSKVLREWLTASEMASVINGNIVERINGVKDVCHSHDYCDANMAMVAAFEKFGLPTPGDEIGENSFALWNEAWELAILAEFDPAKVLKLASKKK